MSVEAPEAPVRRAPLPAWYRSLARYETPDTRKAFGQLADTLIPYALLWVAMVQLLHRGVPYLWISPLLLLAAGLLIRTFILFHDCCHGSFFESRLANRITGYICGILAFTAYDNWKHPHGKHHATAGDLDRRGVGDIWTLTTDEFAEETPWRRLVYWFVRNPWFMLTVGPVILFLFGNRFPHRGAGPRERASILHTNLALLAIFTVASLTIGWKTYLMIQIPTLLMAGSMGIWLFYVQHQYEGVHWERHEQWDPIQAALQGSSYYKLPKVLQWFSGNIGLHHIHHLRPRIPNYNLQRCYDEVPELREVPTLTLAQSLKSLRMNAWDETGRTLVSFRGLANFPALFRTWLLKK